MEALLVVIGIIVFLFIGLFVFGILSWLYEIFTDFWPLIIGIGGGLYLWFHGYKIEGNTLVVVGVIGFIFWVRRG